MNIHRLLVLSCFVGFILSAATGLWAAYDQTAALWRFGLLALCLLPIFLAEVLDLEARMRVAPTVAMACLLLAYTIGIAYLAHNDFANSTLSGEVGSSLAVLLPLSVGAAAWMYDHSTRLTFVGALLALVVLVLALVVTQERTAWLSTALGGLVALGLGWPFRGQVALNWRAVVTRITSFGLGLAGVFYLALFWVPFEQWLASWLPNALYREIAERMTLWHNTLALIADYPFTGSGLRSLRMTLASYVYLTHVPVQRHAHQLFLQIAAEQGWLGAISFGGLLLIAIHGAAQAMRSPNRDWRGLRLGVLATLFSLLIYGLVDAEMYVYNTVPAVFLPLVCALLVRSSSEWQSDPPDGGRRQRRTLLALTVALVSVVLIGGWLDWRPLRAQILANRGAVAQSKAELAVYHWPEWGIQDAVRRDPAINLATAQRYYHAALSIDPNNVTALRRLGQIALARGNFAEAERALFAAWRLRPGQRASRQLLGEVYAISGYTDQAAAWWQTVALAEGQLDERLWWYGQLDDAQGVVNLRAAMARLQSLQQGD